MDRWKGKVAIVTGASEGIGATIAEELVKAGVLVVGLARRLEKLEELAASLKEARGKFYARKCDIGKEEDLLNTFKWVKTALGGVDILVNNAAIGKNSKIIDDDINSFRNILDVNVLAIAICIREAVASMKSRDAAGYIININSVYGHYLPPASFLSSLYSPSKFAITALTETVRKELATEENNKIKITSISPGLVKTGMVRSSGWNERLYEVAPYLLPEDVADAALYVLGTPHKVEVTELTIRATGEV